MPYATLIFPTAPTPFTYEIGEELIVPGLPAETSVKVEVGDLVIAPLRSKPANGLVIAVSNEKPTYATKKIASIARKNVLTEWQIATLAWIAEYYHAHVGVTARLFFPERVWTGRPLKRATKIPTITPLPRTEWKLNEDQQRALDAITGNDSRTENCKLKTKNFLLHGITGSGKTEVYLRAIQHALNAGKQAILLVPEIALTPQLVGYLAAVIPPEKIVVIHSQLAEGVRLAAWERIKSGEVQLVIGSRSALFAPVTNLGLIILDEEHEWTYKNDQTPRYHARAVAQKIAEFTGATLVFGSATPSLETYTAARAKRIQLLELPRRVDNIPLPTIDVVDLRNELKKQNYSVFSELLAEKIHERLARGEQTILFLNKRGFASALLCRDCGDAMECPHCAIPLTLHRTSGREKLMCHVCGYFAPIPRTCPTCGGLRIRELGTGTQKLETAIAAEFPTARVIRADRDTTTRVGSHAKLFEEFKTNGDILIGTQIIAKGLDLPNVTLVGVLLADIGLHLPDFRAGERTFDLLTQVAGRAGRRDKPGEVVIQTYSPEHPAVQAASRHDYAAMYAAEIAERKQFGYPPFSRIVKFAFVDRDEKKARRDAEQFAAHLKKQVSLRGAATGGDEAIPTGSPRSLAMTDVVTVAPALVTKLHDKYHYHVIWRGQNPTALFEKIEIPDGCRVDVDPVSVV